MDEEAYNKIIDNYEEITSNLMARIRRESQYEVKFYIQLESGHTLLDKPFDYFQEANDEIFERELQGAKVVSRKESPLLEIRTSMRED